MLIDPAISLALAVTLAALFAASAAHKLTDFQRAVAIVSAYRVAPSALAPIISATVVAIELVVAVGLLTPAFRDIAAIGAAGLLLVYATAIGVNLARGRRDIDCGCSFGASGERLTPVLIFRNFGLAIFAMMIAAPVGARSLGLFDIVSVAIFVLSAAALYLAFEGLRANAARLYAAGGSR